MRLPAETENELPGMMVRSASRDRPVASERRESAIRRYFYDTLASYLSLYVRPEDVVVEINPLSKGLGERFTNYRATPCVEALKTSAEPTPDYILLNGAIHYERDVQEMLNRIARIAPRIGASSVCLLQHALEAASAIGFKNGISYTHAGAELDRSRRS